MGGLSAGRGAPGGEPFRVCLECEVNLVASGDPYVIEKAFRVYPGFGTTDTIFEYALCLPCMERLYESYSKESRRAIEQYFYANETIDQLDDFSGRHFGLPPEFDQRPRRVMPVL